MHAVGCRPVLLNLFLVATQILAENRPESFGDPVSFTDFIWGCHI